ncbi:uncharacterized protein MYCFIDRAFT_46936 [Pseudocercospora fijiensis CIRAD86]|uniref:Non-homologous end-joining factor 1 n=1 Tax=Pseudocercospora fijiensis (strain CIRAD86) TaxID=383855 RepID=M3AET8_PSEFD|nr:uncharacterized protein MYCFIDRAFT_46936 [Pseudocercospora fijiensis CIRAD86]EME83131.1 hypothetical protein MYCFIDRAFT_46936 [Pseudocercospora fijiensis CIRAD86]
MVVDRPWKALMLPKSYPPLWLKARLDGRHAAIELTDLNRIWGMQMSKAELVRQARDQSCSIDPGEDSEQYDQFLSKVESALTGQKRTTLSLVPGDAQDWITLDVSAPLPGSLPTFKWRIELHPWNEPGSTVIESYLLTPFLLYTSHLRLQMQQLVEELGHKDRVIAKITDKLETTGNDLTQVFPGLSNVKTHRKTSQRSQLASHIRGLADFDEKAWRDQSVKSGADTDLSVDDIDRILAELPQPRPSSEHRSNSGAWYRNGDRTEVNGKAHTKASAATDGATANRQGMPKASTNAPPDASMHSGGDDNDDGDFQRQATPPKHSRQREGAFAQDETQLEAGTNGTETSAMNNADLSQAVSASARPPPKQKLGTICGKKAKTPEPEPEPEAETDDDANEPAAPTRSSISHGALKGKSKSRSHRATPPTSPAAATEPVEVSAQKRKGKLGTFGAKEKSTSPPPQDADPETEAREAPAKTVRPKLGAFGGKFKRKACPVLEGDNEHGKAESEVAPSPSAVAQEMEGRQSRARVKEERTEQASRESSAERANRKRDDLRRQMEDESKAPAKKKRRF